MEETFSDKLARLLNNSKFKKYVNSTVEENSDIDFKEFKQELENTKLEKAKNRRLQKIKEKRNYLENKKKTKDKNDQNKEIKSLIKEEEDDQIKSEEENSKNKEDDTHPNIFFLKDKENNDKIYTFHRTYKEYYYLRCNDRHCSGTAKYNTLTGIITEINECNMDYSNHSYVKESIIKKKIESNTIKVEEIENNSDTQKIIFKYMLTIHPLIGYYNIVLILHEKYNLTKILYSLTQFNIYKKAIKKENKYYYDREKIIDEIKFNNENLLKVKLEYNSKNLIKEKI